MEEFIEKLKADGSLTQLKWFVIWCLIGAVFGAFIGASTVAFGLKPGPSSTSAKFVCVDLDEEAVRQYYEKYGTRPKVSFPAYDCDEYDETGESVVGRIKHQMLLYGIYGTGIGVIVGCGFGYTEAEKERKCRDIDD